MTENQTKEQAKQEISKDDEKWKEFNEFKSAHELQLFGMQFPDELTEKLFVKLKYEIFDTDNFFEIMDNQDENRYLLRAKQNLKKNDQVFLIDHCWTLKLRQFNYFCENFPNIIKRVTTMLKYGNYKKSIINVLDKDKENTTEKKNISTYNNDVVANELMQKNLDYDGLNLTDDTIDLIKISPTVTETLSIEDNKIENIQLIEELLENNKNLKAFWCRDNVFCDVNENYEKDFYTKFPNLELLNRKLTPNATSWAINYLINTPCVSEKQKIYEEYNNCFGKRIILDLSGRDPFIVKNFEIFSKIQNGIEIIGVDISDNEYDFSKNENKEKLINFIQNFSDKLEYIIVDDEDNIFNMEEQKLSPDTYNIFMDNDLLKKLNTKIKYINEISIKNILERNSTYDSLLQLKRENYVHKYMWSINRTYRLVTSEKYDEDSIYYFNDEFGSAINHSDVPNCCMFPLIYSKSGKFQNDELITYSLLWAKKDIKKGDEIFIDYLANISENEERSSRLTCWYNTPRDYFEKKFENKLLKFKEIKNNNLLLKYCENVNKLIEQEKKGEKISDEEIQKIFNFDLCNKDEKLITETIQKIKDSISNYVYKSKTSSEYFSKNFDTNNKKIKVCTDLPYVKENLKIDNMEFTTEISEADIVWLNKNIFTVLESCNLKLKNNGENVFLNQFPYESIVTMKSNLSDLIQSNLGLNDIIGLSYNMTTELAEIIGNFHYNEDNNFDNSWILKPINMSRSMDMLITNNLREIIRALETGPKICQKYYINPYLMNNKKFDLRFIIAIKNLLPLELYFYDKMFWIRSANKDYIKDPLSFDDYEVHFTVMNYSKFGMQTIYDKDFIKYLKDRNIEWAPIYKKLQEKVKKIFLLACKDCPQMINYTSRAIYGLDAMIDDNLEPHVIEMNFQPDCTRACKFVPEYYNDLFSTLFLEKESGMSLVE